MSENLTSPLFLPFVSVPHPQSQLRPLRAPNLFDHRLAYVLSSWAVELSWKAIDKCASMPYTKDGQMLPATRVILEARYLSYSW